MQIIISIMLSLFLSASYAAAETVKNQNSSSVVAQVNGEKIYKEGIDTIIADLRRSGSHIDDKVRKKLINRLVEQKLFAQFARKKEYHKRESVKRQIEVMTEMVLKDNYLSDLVLDNITQSAIQSEFDLQMKDYKAKYEYKASHILVKEEETAKEVKKKLEHGADFSAIAKQYSIDSNANSGGDLGYFSTEMMVKPFSDAVVKLKKNMISMPVKTDFGWHVIKLYDKRLLPKPTLAEMKPRIEVQLSRKVMSEHLEMLKKKSNIKIFE